MAGIRRKQPEQEFHKTVARFLDAALPPSCWWTTFPSGGGGKARGGKLKAMGLKPGVADILILSRDGNATQILWLELKAATGRLSPAQSTFVADMHRFPCLAVATCRELGDVRAALQWVGIAPRAGIAA